MKPLTQDQKKAIAEDLIERVAKRNKLHITEVREHIETVATFLAYPKRSEFNAIVEIIADAVVRSMAKGGYGPEYE